MRRCCLYAPAILASHCFAILLFSIAVGSSEANASPLDLFGYGARAQAMAGAVTSSAEGHESVYYNPAGLAFDTEPSFTLGYQRADFYLDINGERQDILEAPALVLGFAVPVPFGGWLTHRLSLGLGFVLPTTTVLRAQIPLPGQENFVLVGNRAQTVSIQGAVGVRVFDWLSLGFGFLTLANLEGSIDVEPNESGHVGADVQDNLLASYSPVAGLMLKPTSWIALGVMARGESEANYAIPITVDLGDSFSIPIPDLDISGTAQYDPAQIAIELSGNPADNLLVSFGAIRKNWSGFNNPIVYTAVPEDYPVQPEPGFKDIWSWRAGGEGTFVNGAWTLFPRVGVAFEPTPAPSQTGLHNYLDSDRTILATGLGVHWDNLRLNLSAQWHVMEARSHTKEEALLRSETAIPEEETLDQAAGYPNISHTGSIFFWSTEIGVTF